MGLTRNRRTLQRWGVRLLLLCATSPAAAQRSDAVAILQGTVRDGRGHASTNATVVVGNVSACTDEAGHYALRVPVARNLVAVWIGTATLFQVELQVDSDRTFDVDLGEANSVTVSAPADPLTPDPATQAYAHGESLDANPGLHRRAYARAAP